MLKILSAYRKRTRDITILECIRFVNVCSNDKSNIGNFLRRILKYNGFKVNYTQIAGIEKKL